jgi:hypothetical protein
MSRIFLALASFAISLLIGNLILAFAMGDFGAKSEEYAVAHQTISAARATDTTTSKELLAHREHLERIGVELAEQRNRFWPHIWLGIAASLISLLVNSISITYFIGTNRWCREVADAYGMSDEFSDRSAALKRRSFGWAFIGILLTLAIAGTGGAADPFSSTAEPASWVVWHWTLGMGGVALIATSFYAQFTALSANHRVIQDVLADAARIRAERSVAV